MRKVSANSLKNLAPQWKPGVSPNPAGRPQGARSKLQELTLRFLHKDFAEHGEETIRRVREKHPHVYLAAVVSLLPKQAQKLESPFVDLSDEELEQLEHLLAALRAKTVADLARGTEQHSFNEKPPKQRNGQHVVKNAATVTSEPLNGLPNQAEGHGQEPSALLDSDASASDTGSAVSQDGNT